MKFAPFVLGLFAATALPLGAGTIYTINANSPIPITAGTYPAGTVLNITVTGTVNLLGLSDGSYITNPDGSLVGTLFSVCSLCWDFLYEYVNPNSTGYPVVNSQGDGTNHFTGGGTNYDVFPGTHSPWAPEGKQTTDTSDPATIRLGALAYTFVMNPTALDWKVLGYGGTISTATGGTLQLVVADTDYGNDTGSFTANITAVVVDNPEPSVVWLVFSGGALFGLIRLKARRA
jgi:hypothetical protein